MWNFLYGVGAATLGFAMLLMLVEIFCKQPKRQNVYVDVYVPHADAPEREMPDPYELDYEEAKKLLIAYAESLCEGQA